MPILHIPGGAMVRWSPRRQSLVTISHRLPVWWGSAPSEHGFIEPLTVKLPRAVLEHMAQESSGFDLETQIAQTLLEAARRPPRTRKPTMTLSVVVNGPAPSKLRISLPRLGLQQLRRALEADSGDLTPYQNHLPALIAMWLFTDFVPTVVAASPKGPRASEYRLNRYLPAALLGAHTLVEMGDRNPQLRRRIEELVREDPELTAYLQVCQDLGWNTYQARVVGLVDRAFRGAWDAADHPGLIYTCSKDVAFQVQRGLRPSLETRYRDPANVLDEYLYGRRRQPLSAHVSQVKKAHPAAWDLTFNAWQYLYLGAPGAAAKEFRLLP